MRRVLRHLYMALLALALAGCGGPPRLKPLSPESVVLCFGDSLTSGYGADEAESYPAVLEGLLGCTVVNAGVSGEVSEEGLERLPLFLKRHKPALVVLCHGGNDMLRKIDDATLANNLRGMIEAARAAGADVVIFGVPRPGLFLKTPDFYAEVAKTCGVPYDGKVIGNIFSTPSQKSDLIHPNAAGYRVLAERVAEMIRNNS